MIDCQKVRLVFLFAGVFKLSHFALMPYFTIDNTLTFMPLQYCCDFAMPFLFYAT